VRRARILLALALLTELGCAGLKLPTIGPSQVSKWCDVYDRGASVYFTMVLPALDLASAVAPGPWLPVYQFARGTIAAVNPRIVSYCEAERSGASVVTAEAAPVFAEGTGALARCLELYQEEQTTAAPAAAPKVRGRAVAAPPPPVVAFDPGALVRALRLAESQAVAVTARPR
jgi:hypothetical protein